MTTHNKAELSLFSEVLLSVLLTACLAIFLFKFNDTFPWLSFIGIPIGLAVIIACWEQKKNSWSLLITGLVLNTIVWSVVFNWTSFF
ncbi:hypothetical protein B5V89_14320 [Heyndrickxia sporothermodurans]|uniref:Uncharacterized protein n=1 Tax=Heyndrickxia vini TaxID=1476025 RepID=A0ABX7E1F1_9BACI|nr:MULTISPECIES: hypothetical protein [Heyndrickxia]PTY77618.1 hypothetical protein B5V89_14320 [Heyndrickxia sporothermodurans]QQZ09362.1 hypothetical protein I5776_20785 [Heyndrickxia vini]